VIGIGAVGLAIAAATYAPGRPAYTLTRDSLTIHDRFYAVTLRAGDVDVAGVRVVDLATESEWRTTARTNGFANSHYQSGWYKVRGGQKIRLYRADATRLVLLPPKGTGAAVLLDAKDPEEFVQKVRREWGSGS